ncbi:MAG TPA: phosphoribosylformylglycinamidine cyclo-ligase [Kofleriaceae bacterium]|nr:phosphoribosylformylglycinamidine cyclo-ligase [Kofleriaceae bacterium]
MGWTYKDAGVDIDAGDRLVERIRPLAARASRPEVLAGVGGFAGLCRLPERYRDPVLVSGTDGVGTKLKTAFATGRHGTVGIDLVAMSVNDVAVTGAEPLFFLDYFATSSLEVAVAAEVIGGIAEGCRQAGCALLGGETAEMPGMYAPGEYDLAGFCVGVVERDGVRDGSAIEPGDRVLGLASTGLHSNGHSLARKILLEVLALGLDDQPPALGGASVADELLRPTRIYVPAFRALAGAGVRWKGAAHITGGGLIDNPPRMFGARRGELAIELDTSTWSRPGVFALITSAGVAEEEMRRTFNLGLGMLIAVGAEEAERALAALAAAGQEAALVGAIRRRGPDDPAVRFL